MAELLECGGGRGWELWQGRQIYSGLGTTRHVAQCNLYTLNSCNPVTLYLGRIQNNFDLAVVLFTLRLGLRGILDTYRAEFYPLHQGMFEGVAEPNLMTNTAGAAVLLHGRCRSLL